jgi:uncharacterized protein
MLTVSKFSGQNAFYTKSRPGVILVIVLFCMVLTNLNIVLASPILPKPSANLYIFDHAGLINASDMEDMQRIAKAIDQKTKAQIVAVTVDNLAGLELEDYALQLFRNWGIGHSEENNGILILVNKESLVKNQRGRIRIEVGYGLEGAINDGKAGAILDTFALPAFESGDYSRGIKETFLAVSSEVAKEYKLDIENEGLSDLESYAVNENNTLVLAIVFALLIFILIFILAQRKRGGNYHRGPFNGPFFGPFGSGGFKGGGSGGFGGGFRGGGFGGGSSGGGGASR